MFRNDDDPKNMSFFEKFMLVRHKNKLRLVRFLQVARKDPQFLAGFNLKSTIFEGFLKKVTKSARHIMLVFYVVKRYLALKQMVSSGIATNQLQIVPRVVFVGGLSRPGDQLYLSLLKLINTVAK